MRTFIEMIAFILLIITVAGRAGKIPKKYENKLLAICLAGGVALAIYVGITLK